MIGLLQNLTDPESIAVVGLIFDVDSTMTAESTYPRPPIMSEATPTQCASLKPYCYNEQTDPALN